MSCYNLAKEIDHQDNVILYCAMEDELMAKSILIKDTTREEREEIVRKALSCSDGCENCTGCQLGVGDAFEMYRPYIEGKKEIRDINMEYNARYNIH